MKIYDKTLPEIFREMAWQHKFVVIIGTIFLIFAVIYVPYSLFSFKIVKTDPRLLSLVSSAAIDNAMDPSMASDGKKVYLVYTDMHTDMGSLGGLSLQPSLASSYKGCKDFHVTNATPIISKTEEILGPDRRTPLGTGTWRVETPTIIHDPTDTSAPWKIFAHKYFWFKGKPLAQLYSMIVMTSSTNPEAVWSTEKWIFGTDNQIPPSPYNELTSFKLNDLHPSLKNIRSYARPSAVMVDDYIVMSLSAYLKGRDAPDRIIMIMSPDHGRTWQYMGTPFIYDDLLNMKDYTKIAGASLIKQDGEVFLSLVLGNDQHDNAGTHLFAFSDFGKGELVRNATTNTLNVAKKLPLYSEEPSKTGGGFAAYSDLCGGSGIITSEFSDLRNAFVLFQTYQKPISAE